MEAPAFKQKKINKRGREEKKCITVQYVHSLPYNIQQRLIN